jgi:hypothetical protein
VVGDVWQKWEAKASQKRFDMILYGVIVSAMVAAVLVAERAVDLCRSVGVNRSPRYLTYCLA